jgi:UDP-glucuronate 4-epimerase
VLDRPPHETPPYRLYNIGNSRPMQLMHFIALLEKNLGREAKKNLLPLQKGDVLETCADIADLERDTGWKPETTIEEGVARFTSWYREYYRL